MNILKLKSKAEKNSQKQRCPGGQRQIQHIRSWIRGKEDDGKTHRLGGNLGTLGKTMWVPVSCPDQVG